MPTEHATVAGDHISENEGMQLYASHHCHQNSVSCTHRHEKDIYIPLGEAETGIPSRLARICVQTSFAAPPPAVSTRVTSDAPNSFSRPYASCSILEMLSSSPAIGQHLTVASFPSTCFSSVRFPLSGNICFFMHILPSCLRNLPASSCDMITHTTTPKTIVQYSFLPDYLHHTGLQ
jgi:hypothetical protein